VVSAAALIGRDGRRYPLTEPRWRGEDGSPLLVSPLPGITRADIDHAARSHWRYARALPLALAPLTLGEGCTPLLEQKIAGVDLLIKPEWFNPTGSFKDRGTSVMISLLAHQRVPAILEDSSGNGGASVAAYAAAAGIAAKILAPESTSGAKLLQSRMHGAELELVPGPRQATADEAVRQSGERFYASHNWHPFFLQGTKTLAYELWEDLGFTAPDNVVIPTGAGSNVLGCWIGFKELLAAGQIAKLPRIFVAQPLNCSPIDASFMTGAETLVERIVRPTIAEGTAIRRPVRLQEILQALRETDGKTVALTEEQIAAAVRRLAASGLYAEPTSASAAAAIEVLAQRGDIKASETTVALLTGTGLKSTQFMTELFGAAVAV